MNRRGLASHDICSCHPASTFLSPPYFRLDFLVALLLRRSAGQQSRSITNTHDLTLLHALDGESGDERGTYTRTVFGGKDLDRIGTLTKRTAIPAFGPVENFLESLCTAGLRTRFRGSANGVKAQQNVGDAGFPLHN
jgi:hypothetical protein